MSFNDERRLSSAEGGFPSMRVRLQRGLKPLVATLAVALSSWTWGAPASAQSAHPFRLGLTSPPRTTAAATPAPSQSPTSGGGNAPLPQPPAPRGGQTTDMGKSAPSAKSPSAPSMTTPTGAAEPVRVRDVAHIGGTNTNPLVGYGLVMGLQGTGDTQGTISQQMLTRMLQSLGMNQPVQNLRDNLAITMKNTAVVMLTADLPAYARPGDAVDVRVASMADAKSLMGGVLAVSLLKAADGQVYASAQGPLVIGDRAATGVGLGVQTSKPHLNSGIVINGGLVSRPAPAGRLDAVALLQWVLNKPDFEVASKVAAAINKNLPGITAVARDASVVEVNLSNYEAQGPTVEIVSQMGRLPLDVETSKVSGKVTFDTRDGEVLEGADVRLRPGVVHAAGIRIEVAPEGGTVGDLVRYLAQLGVPVTRRAEVLRALTRDKLLRADLKFQVGATIGTEL